MHTRTINRLNSTSSFAAISDIRAHRSFAANRSTNGFTLVELLVVIAIIGVLVGLLLPAVQAAREAARRSSCLNNMMQIGLSVHHHDFSHERLPAGVISETGPVRNEPIGAHISWMVQILPFIEQQSMFEHFDQEAGVYATVNSPVRVRNIATYLCPSFPSAKSDFSIPLDDSMEPGYAAISNYAGCHHSVEAPIDSNNNGMLFLNSHLRYSDIRDGSSQTIMIGEMIPYRNSLGWCSGTRATLRNTGSKIEGPNRYFDLSLQSDRELGSLKVGGFGSAHQGGGNFGFADGSTRFLSQNIDPKLFTQLGDRADGELLVQDSW